MRAFQTLQLFSFSSICVGLAYYWHWLNQISPLVLSLTKPEDIAHGYHPVPAWLVPRLKALPRVRVNDSQREELRRLGAIKIPRLVRDGQLLKLFSETSRWVKSDPTNTWWGSGVWNAVVRHSNMAELSATALNTSEVTVWNLQVEPRPPKSWRKKPLPARPWLDDNYGDVTDQSVHEDTDAFVGSLHKAGHFAKPQMSIFLAVTPIPHGIEFLAGSHIHNQKHRCRRDFDTKLLDAACMDRLFEDCKGVLWWDLEPGDAVLFYGSVFHWSILQDDPRLALSVRYIPADMQFTGHLQYDFLPSRYPLLKCGPLSQSSLYPVMYSSRTDRLQDYDWPLWQRNMDVAPWLSWLRRKFWELDSRCGKIVDY